jgi:hypothetical protein
MPEDDIDRLENGYSVMRIHDGTTEEVKDERNGTTLTVSADKFSTYFVTYDAMDIRLATVEDIPDFYYKEGKAAKPAVTLTYKGENLALDTDYTVEYKDNTAVGTATAIITGIGAYTGTQEVTFTIKNSEHEHQKINKQIDREEPTCQKDGSYVEVTYCETCQKEFGRTTVTLEKKSHTEAEDKVNVQEPTCTTSGYTGDVVCKDCGTVLSKGDYTDKLGHTWDSDYTTDKKATCSEEGSKSIHCKNCDETKNVTSIAKLDHDWDSNYTTDKKATCSEEGSKSIHCKNCDETKDATSIAKLAHTWDDGTVTKEPTYTTKGEKTYTCIVCKTTKTEDVDKLPFVKGDVTGDGKVSLEDVTLLFQYVNKQITEDKVKVFEAGDVTGDGKVTLEDVTKLFQYVNHQIKTL